MTDEDYLALQTELEALKKLVNEQADDFGLWHLDTTDPAAYLQQELRKLHHRLECFFQIWLEEE